MAKHDPSRQPTPRRDQLRNRRALVEAARVLFAEQGLDVPLDAIAKRAGLGNATLYRHFPDRRGLIIEALLVNLARNQEAISEAMNCQTGWGGFARYFEWLLLETINNLGYMSALRAVPEGESAEVDRLRTTILREFEELIERAKAEGAFRTDRWIEDVLLVLFVHEHLIRRDREEAVAASRRLFSLALDTLSTRPERGEPREPDEVLTLRQTLGNSLAGLAVNAPALPE
ncbi:TetR/AcrR family transcriptional regulator [Arthrobacter sp. MA-N2]|uniref:TetR/AcrR family transcriptional regulator n=1 Tax=Arthrobacter sp. MA-N2 TaxID=1101188 RepID=UPI0004B85A5E|nr:TetR/AcrR family transcriptional regulator [Arthrobacter sp. MA-N2]